MERFKLLVLSDNPAGSTGLGRVTNDIVSRIHKHLGDVIEVATYSMGEPNESLPWKQYKMEVDQIIPSNLPETWRDFAGDQRGALLSIYNVSWVPYLANPEKFARGELREFLLTKPFERWIYAPIDGDTVPGRLALNMAEALAGFDRTAVYTQFAKRITEKAFRDLGIWKDLAVLPHGVDTSVFYKRDRAMARQTLFERVTGEGSAPIKDDVVLIGICATNTVRKDYGLAMAAAAELVKRGVNVGLWLHTDGLRKSWDLVGLAREYGLTDRIIASQRGLTDEDMAICYSACDVTWGIGSEGWGMPLSESLACGVPVIHMSYAGGADFVPGSMQVDPVGFYHQGFFGVRRPVFNPSDWADMTEDWLSPLVNVAVSDYIKWDNAWETWKQWLLEGVNHG